MREKRARPVPGVGGLLLLLFLFVEKFISHCRHLIVALSYYNLMVLFLSVNNKIILTWLLGDKMNH